VRNAHADSSPPPLRRITGEIDYSPGIIYVEYVPVEQFDIALNNEQREKMAVRIEELRSQNSEIIIISFPGDEVKSGGCVLFDKDDEVKRLLSQKF